MRSNKVRSFLATVLLACGIIFVSACGKSPAGPDPTPTPSQAPPPPTPVAMSVVNGIGNVAVPGVLISVNGTSAAATDPSGNATVTVKRNDALTIDGRQAPKACALPRETLFLGDTQYPLWCQDAGFVQEIVYSWTGKLMRVKGNLVSISIENPGISQAVVEAAAAKMTAATGGNITFQVGGSGGVVVHLKVDPADPTFVQHPEWAAYTQGYWDAAGWTNEAKVVFKSESATSWVPLVLHELGHVFGLGHISSFGLMNPDAAYNFSDFTDAEIRAIQMLIIRTSGSHPSIGQIFPDNDTKVVAGKSSRRGGWLPPIE